MSSPAMVYRDDVSEVWLADSLNQEHVAELMGERKADLLCVDAPYSEKTHSGHRSGMLSELRAKGYGNSKNPKRCREAAYARRQATIGTGGRSDIDYPAWCLSDIEAFCEYWVPRCCGWCVSVTDDVLAPIWGGEFRIADLLTFAPIPLVETGSRVRMMGDGPSNWTSWIVVARPRTLAFCRWGTLPGAYIQPGEHHINRKVGSDRIVGGKPLRSMCALVRDYSRIDDLVVDPCCGAGTTLVAAKILGRRCIGVDNKPEHAELSARLLSDTRQQLTLTSTTENTMDQLQLPETL